MPATRTRVIAAVERSSSESSLYTHSGTSYVATDSDASSSSPAPTSSIPPKQRRTRKRITQVQLVSLENLFTQSSHPSQQQREVLARTIRMDVKNVTIWFQNRRQAARKLALHEAITQSNATGTAEEPGLLAGAHVRHSAAASLTPEQLATPAPANEDRHRAISSSRQSSSTGATTWPPKGSPQLTQNDCPPSNHVKCEPDEDMFAAAIALAQMRTVDIPAA
ncbi:hypothetical protein FRC14_005242 [Serendipita sp. 396]|nr:hypothetical protein FRC14_005242 [Serendipita sp. 396]KAG8780862.1 hypothetical protein FRC15_009215 [Serendipita sp. 397]KAG8867045.1 hypothetical protein FRC20_006836 [Serendipita sp. 405]KAG9056576.1 hypothetical protein FS842_010261 [Serendipita sp. 407]